STEHLECHAVAPLVGLFHRHEHAGTAVAREPALTPQDIRRHDCMHPGPALGAFAHVVDRPLIGLLVAFRYGLTRPVRRWGSWGSWCRGWRILWPPRRREREDCYEYPRRDKSKLDLAVLGI